MRGARPLLFMLGALLAAASTWSADTPPNDADDPFAEFEQNDWDDPWATRGAGLTWTGFIEGGWARAGRMSRTSTADTR
jgi:hypothetical protein